MCGPQSLSGRDRKEGLGLPCNVPGEMAVPTEEIKEVASLGTHWRGRISVILNPGTQKPLVYFPMHSFRDRLGITQGVHFSGPPAPRRPWKGQELFRELAT